MTSLTENARCRDGMSPTSGNRPGPDTGILVISLDFELYWGMRDRLRLDQCRRNMIGAREAVREILFLFDEYKIHATWAAVGFLFFEDMEELRRSIPSLVPRYERKGLSPYGYIRESEDLDRDCHFAPELLEAIRVHDGQEIGSHTFSHYYCLEKGQSIDSFREDVLSAERAARSRGMEIRSMVFPRNQANPRYLSVLNEAGIACYRGNESSWIYRAMSEEDESLLRRAIRLIDAYINISGHHTYPLRVQMNGKPFSLPSSRFLRPYSERLALLEPLRMRRITTAMDDAARKGKVFHMWWHPHNFGTNTRQNMVFLKRVLDHFARLRETRGMMSLNMGELSNLLDDHRR